MTDNKNKAYNRKAKTFIPFRNPHRAYLWFTAFANQCSIKKAYRLLVAKRTVLEASEVNNQIFESYYDEGQFLFCKKHVPYKAEKEEDDIVTEMDLEKFIPLERFQNWSYDLRTKLIHAVGIVDHKLHPITYVGYEPYEHALADNERSSTKIFKVKTYFGIKGKVEEDEWQLTKIEELTRANRRVSDPEEEEGEEGNSQPTNKRLRTDNTD